MPCGYACKRNGAEAQAKETTLFLSELCALCGKNRFSAFYLFDALTLRTMLGERFAAYHFLFHER